MSIHVKKGDTVEIIAGDDKGKHGKVLSVDVVRRRIVVEGVNQVYKHVKPSRRNPQGGRLQVDRPIDISNVLPINHKTNKPTRVRFTKDNDGSKKRIAVDGTVLNVIKYSQK